MIVRYGTALRHAISGEGDINERELGLYQSMMDVMESTEITKQVAGGLSVSSTKASGLSVIPIPGVGNVFGIGSLIADIGSKVVGHVTHQYEWHMLGPEISRTLTKTRIAKKLEELELKKNR